jgi:hypothetical protein
MNANAEALCRVHELHYQTKARAYGLHKNFGCYNFAYRKDTKGSSDWLSHQMANRVDKCVEWEKMAEEVVVVVSTGDEATLVWGVEGK